MDTDVTQKLAERITKLLQESIIEADDSSSLRMALEKINQRLDKIESQMPLQNPQSAFRISHSSHPSQEKFDVAEMIDGEILESLETEKACPYEPTGKPCDHCAMCSSRGF